MFTVWEPMTLAMAALYPWLRRESTSVPNYHSCCRPNLVRTYLLLAAVGVFPGQVFMTWALGCRWPATPR